AVPSQAVWQQLKVSVMAHGLCNQNLQAVAPTGSISYINHATSSIHPIGARSEIRKEGKPGRVYYPAAYMNNDNLGNGRASG
ncbi:ribonucleotide-diphosphate reductase subunit alpha, partial [Morganella morganii]|nr:ribonucleotide-diphosphate reductase subunit alpha [Morganella morganii]